MPRIEYLQAGLESFLSAHLDTHFELIFVDDGSRDHTRHRLELLIQGLSYRFPQNIFLVIPFAKNRGKGAALRAGVIKARGIWTLTMDADLATKPEELFRWRDQHGWNPDQATRTVYFASREHPQSQKKDSWLRHHLGRIFNLLVRKTLGTDVQDSQCGFKLYPTAIAKDLFQVQRIPGWAHDCEILARCSQKNIEICEMPIAWTAGKDSRVNPLSDSVRMFLSVLWIRWVVLNR